MTHTTGRTAFASSKSGSITVRATDFGLPVELDIAQYELRYGGRALADSILALCALAAATARREDAPSTPSERGPWTERA